MQVLVWDALGFGGFDFAHDVVLALSANKKFVNGDVEAELRGDTGWVYTAIFGLYAHAYPSSERFWRSTDEEWETCGGSRDAAPSH